MPPRRPREMILILDFGSQYTQLIARRVRELGVYCEALPPARAAEKIAAAVPGGIILSGGPDSVAAADAPLVPDAVFSCGAPVLAICYGMQATAARFGGVVRPSSRRSYGRAVIHRETDSCDLLDAAFADANELPVWMSHGDHVDEPPPGFAVVARAKNGVVAAIADSRRKIFGLQFHPEVSHTRNGGEILRRFLRSICGLAATWTTPNFIARAVAEIRARVGDGKGFVGAVGRSRFGRRRVAVAARDRRQFNLRFDRQRADAGGRSRASARGFRRKFRRQARGRGLRGALFRGVARRRRSGRKTPRHRARVRARFSSGGRRGSKG